MKRTADRTSIVKAAGRSISGMRLPADAINPERSSDSATGEST
jgi:hypothetical protein